METLKQFGAVVGVGVGVFLLGAAIVGPTLTAGLVGKAVAFVVGAGFVAAVVAVGDRL